MAEALGVAAKVIAVIELTDRVVELCRACIIPLCARCETELEKSCFLQMFRPG